MAAGSKAILEAREGSIGFAALLEMPWIFGFAPAGATPSRAVPSGCPPF